MKFLAVTAFALLLLAAPALAEVTYTINPIGNDAFINSTLTLRSQTPINIWDVSWQVPDNSIIFYIRDPGGDIQFTQDGRSVKFKTNRAPASTRRDVEIAFASRGSVDTTHDPLRILGLTLSGFPGEATKATVNVNNFISGDYNLGASAKEFQDRVEFTSPGPLNIRALFGRGRFYNHYEVFGSDADFRDAEGLYPLIAGTLGFVPRFTRFAVLVLPDSEYDVVGDPWSAGTYRSGGLIVLRESSLEKGDHLPILLHETTHAYVRQFIRWDHSNISWFDEGVATYIEYLVKERLNKPQGGVFGEDVKVREGQTIVTYSSRGDKDGLFSYYQQGNNFMRAWNPARDADKRSFGYAFSELVVRKFILDRGPRALHDVFRQLIEIKDVVEDSDEVNSVILSAMNSGLEPCKFLSRSSFDSCLEEVNKAAPTFLFATTTEPEAPMEPEQTDNETVLPPVEPEITELPTTPEPQQTGIFSQIAAFFQGLINAILGLFS